MFLGLLFMGGLVPETLCFTRFLQDFESKKKTTFGARFSSILDPPEPKNLYFTMFFDDFTKFHKVQNKKEKTAPGAGSMCQDGPRVPSLGPDSTDHNTPSRTNDRKTFVGQTSNIN